VNHADVRDRLTEYLEGDLSLDRRALVDAHLDACDACNGELDQLRTTIQLLRSLPDVEPPALLVPDVMRRIRAGEASPSVAARLREFIGELFAPGVAVPAGAMVVAFAMALASGKFQILQFVPSFTAESTTTAAIDLPAIPREAQVLATRAFSGAATHRQAVSPLPGGESPLVVSRPPTVFQVVPAATSGAAPRVRVVVHPRRVAAFTDGLDRTPSSADDWLAVVLEQPAEFAARQASLTLAERDHWVRVLASRAVEKRVAVDAVRALRNVGTPEASALASSFAAKAQLASEQIATAR